MVVTNASELTEHEEELYDRQIRLWGLEAQKRLRGARVLVIGLNGLGAEVVKNIILAGIKSLTLLDHLNVTEIDSHNQFLVQTDSVGKNRADESLERAKSLNPLVNVTTDTGNIDDKPDEFFAHWEVIVASGLTTAQYIRLNSLARANSVKFFCGDVFGFFGYSFSDLQSHEYVETKGEKINSTKSKIDYPSLDDALEVDFSAEENRSKLPKIDPCYFIMKILMKFRNDNKRDPSPSKVEEDTKALLKLRDAEEANIPYLKDKIPDEIFRMIYSQLSPVCAIIGGVLAQEVIKAVSQNDIPLNNMFFFNPLKNCGLEVCIGG